LLSDSLSGSAAWIDLVNPSPGPAAERFIAIG
jgi:hypothetical protein